MTRHDDLPLFRWTPPIADVIPFPATKRVGKIRRTAEVIFNSTDKAAAAHWRRTQDDLRRQMERAGIPTDRIDSEVLAFFDAVQAQINRRSLGGAQRWPDGGDAA